MTTKYETCHVKSYYSLFKTIIIIFSNFVHWVDPTNEQASIQIRSVTSPTTPVVTLSPHTYADCVAVPFSELRVDICKSITATLTRSVWLSRKAELLSALVVLPVQVSIKNEDRVEVYDNLCNCNFCMRFNSCARVIHTN